MGKKWIYIVIAVILVVALAAGAGIYLYMSGNNVGKIDGQNVTKAEYQFFVNVVKAQMGSMGITDMKQKVQDKTAGEMVKEGALDSLQEYKIQLIKAKENNIKFTSDEEKQINDYFDNNIAKNYGTTKLEQDTKIKAETGVTLKQYKEIYKNYQLTQKFKQSEQNKIKISDDEAKKKYDEKPSDYDEVTVRHILFMTIDQNTRQPLSEDKIKEAEKKANETLAKVNAGGDFAALAKELSEDPGSKDKGGEYTITKNGQMVKEFEDWAFSHKPGDKAEIVKTSYGYHIMEVTKRTPRDFDKVKDEIKTSLQKTKADESYQKNLEAWKKDAKYKFAKNDKVINSVKI